MKNFVKKFLLAIIPVFAIFLSANAQTNVSGGIFTNTIWTAANSPYIITSTVVVFPGYVLTIEPGVTVKFEDGQQLEIRQSQLIASGTNSAPINFTSNSATPSAGIYSGIYLNGVTIAHTFDYCNFSYADFGIRTNSTAGLIVINSSFISNNTGVFSGAYATISDCLFRFNMADGIRIVGGNITNCQLVQNSTGMEGGGYFYMNNCVIDSNSTGIGTAYGSLLSCVLRHNGTAINCLNSVVADSCIINSNGVGVAMAVADTIRNSIVDSNSVVGINALWGSNDVYNCLIRHNAVGIYEYRLGNFTYPHNTITNNTIENDSIGILLTLPGEYIHCNRICNNTAYGIKYTASQNTIASDNYWCTTDSATAQSDIYDAHDNVSSGILTIMPLDTVQCYLVNPVVTGIAAAELHNFSFSIFPNPASDHLTVKLPASISKTEIQIFNMVGELEYSSGTNTNVIDINISDLGSGMHFIQVTNGNSVVRQKFVKE